VALSLVVVVGGAGGGVSDAFYYHHHPVQLVPLFLFATIPFIINTHYHYAELIKPSLRVLNINKSATASDKGLRAVSEVCNTLERLEVARCPCITDVGIREVLLVSSSLRVFNVGNVIGRGK